jgi:hypothetical protein
VRQVKTVSDDVLENQPQQNDGSVAKGFFLGLGPGLIINLMSGCASFTFSNEHLPLPGFLLGVALGQTLFTLPFYRHFDKQEKYNTCRGLLIGASVSCLIGVACGATFSVNLR